MTPFELPADYDLVNIFTFAADLEAKINSGNFHFLFIGPTGCGKTFLMEHIAKHHHWDDEEYKWKLKDAHDLTNKYMLAKLADKGRMNSVRKLTLELRDKRAGIDDIGAERSSIPAQEFLGDLLTNRYKQIRKGECISTIVTSNLTFDMMVKRYTDRVASRLVGVFTIFKFGDYDFRQDKGRDGDRVTTIAPRMTEPREHVKSYLERDNWLDVGLRKLSPEQYISFMELRTKNGNRDKELLEQFAKDREIPQEQADKDQLARDEFATLAGITEDEAVETVDLFGADAVLAYVKRDRAGEFQDMQVPF